MVAPAGGNIAGAGKAPSPLEKVPGAHVLQVVAPEGRRVASVAAAEYSTEHPAATGQVWMDYAPDALETVPG
jgi:hypothetical protein